MPADNKIWTPPLLPKDQEKLASFQIAFREQEKLVRLRRKQAKQRIDRAGFWLNLAGVIAIPFVVTILGLYATQQITQQQAQLSEKQHQTDVQIANDQQQETVLQTYLDRMSDLLLNNKLQESQPGDEVRNVARARTLTVLPQLNGGRKGELVRFLYEAGLINTEADFSDAKSPIIDLQGADLRRANLKRVNLKSVKLGRVNLNNAEFDNADLSGASLVNTNLRGAKFDNVDLSGADFYHADLSGADFTGANTTPKQLKRAKSLKDATMPDGSKHP